MTSLSIGKIIRKLLTGDDFIRDTVSKVFPVVTDSAKLPYIAYRRAGMEPQANSAGNADSVTVEVLCFTEDYESGIELAEAVRRVLDCRQDGQDGLRMRSCVLSDGEEMFLDDAFIQRLVFTIKA